MPSAHGSSEILEAIKSLQEMMCERLDRLEGRLGVTKIEQNGAALNLSGEVRLEAFKSQVLKAPGDKGVPPAEADKASDDAPPTVESPGEGSELTGDKAKDESKDEIKQTTTLVSSITASKTSDRADTSKSRLAGLMMANGQEISKHEEDEDFDSGEPAKNWQHQLDRWRRRARRFLGRYIGNLDWIAIPVIITNTVCIGIEVQHSIDGRESKTLETLEHCFLSFFIIELILRMIMNHGDYMRSGWLVLDASCVVVGVVSDWIVAPILYSTSMGGVPVIGHFEVIKVLRLLRLTRSLRLLEMFPELWALTSGLFSAARTVAFACVLLIMAVYIFACVLSEMLATSKLRNHPATKELIADRFPDLLRTFMTTWSFTNADSIGDIYEPLIAQDPSFAFVFVPIWIVVSVALMNLVTAVIVDTAIERHKTNDLLKRAEMRKKIRALTPHIEDLFVQLDKAEDGSLEVKELSLTGIDMHKDLRNVIEEDKLKDLFQFLDLDGSGTIDKGEFVDGIMHLTLQNVPIETTQTLQLLRTLQREMGDFRTALAEQLGITIARLELQGGASGSEAVMI
jgi:voltage-gated sodium channel